LHLFNQSKWLRNVLPFLAWSSRVNSSTVRKDSVAGFTGAIIVLPQAVAFATIAGLPPEYGLYAAMVPAIIAALFGSSWHLVSGPTTAISIVVYATLSPLAEPGSASYIQLALTLTFLTGAFQLLMGVARMGALVNFISHSVVIGFTAGAAILISSSQIKNFLGLPIPRGAHFQDVILYTFSHLGDTNPYILAVSGFTLLIGILTKVYLPRVPYMIVAMVLGSLLAFGFNQWFGIAITEIGTVGALPAHLPPLSMPTLSIFAMTQLAPSALAVTMLALTEAVSISRSIAVKSHQRIDGNQEFIGQGLSNLFGAFFSGYASSGSFNRSGLNYAAGAVTPMASIFAAIFLGLIVLLVAPLAAYLPIPAMAGILFLVAWGLIDFHHIKNILRASKSESIVLITTLLATLFVELEFAIYVGVILSLMMYLNRTSKPAMESVVPDQSSSARKSVVSHLDKAECPQIKLVRVNGSLFFGAVSHVQNELASIDEKTPTCKHVLLLLKGVNFIDVAGSELFAQEAKRRTEMGGGLYLYGLKSKPLDMLRQGGYLQEIGEDHFFQSKSAALSSIVPHLNGDICRHCQTRIFLECEKMPKPYSGAGVVKMSCATVPMPS